MKVSKTFIIIVIFLLFIPGCSKKNQQKKSRVERKIISELQIDPAEPTSADDVRIIPVFANKYDRRVIKYSHDWFVNNRQIMDSRGILLSKDKFKRGDKVHCLVSCYKNDKKIEEKKSKRIRIRNSPPRLLNSPPADVDTNGFLQYRIIGDDEDGDSLEYRLVSPLDKGISLDTISGQLKWYIGTASDPGTRPKIPDIAVVIEIIDSDGGRTRKKIRLARDSTDSYQ